MKLLLIGDMHFKAELGYSDYVVDGRAGEKKKVLDFLVSCSSSVDGVIFMGDNLNSRNNPSEVIRSFVEFVERFKDKKIYLLSGNHEKVGDGKSAIDFMKEVNKPNWHVITKIEKIENLVFLPFLYKGEVNALNNEALKKWIMKNLPEGDYLFGHHTISDMFLGSMSTNDFTEVVLNKNKLEAKYKGIFMGHIHEPSRDGKTVMTGSTFTDCVGELEKFCYTLDTETSNVEKLKLPCRAIYKLENPTEEQIDAVEKDSIAKVIFTDRKSADMVEKVKSRLTANKVFFKIIEQYSERREKLKKKVDIVDLSLENLLKVYAEQKKISVKQLMEGFSLIKL